MPSREVENIHRFRQVKVGGARARKSGATFRLLTALVANLLLASATFAAPANAETPVPAIRGDVRDGANGAPIAGAAVGLETPGGARISSTTSDRVGAFVLAAPPPGRYRITADARGYRAGSIALTIAQADSQHVGIALTRDGRISEIGRVVSSASGGAGAAPVQRISAGVIADEGSLRVSDALANLPGITVSGDALAPGGDAYVSLRGLRPGESQTLLDGHPVGPIGIEPDAPDTDGTIAGFNYQDAPYFALRQVAVSFGAGGSGKSGSDAIGGTVDLLTYEPTERDQFVVQQGFGNEGRAFTALRATGTAGKLGYALANGVVGTYGLFSGAPIAQTGLRGTDFTSETLAGLTYPVSGDYVLRNDLARITYAPAPATRIAFSAYDATSWADKTGEGDNDFNPYSYVFANAPVGASARCPHGVLVSTDGGPQCISPSAYAAAASGPAGGGPGAWQALRDQDYDLHATSAAGENAYALDAFTDQYAVLYNRDASAASGPLDTFLDRWSTQGVRLSDDLTGRANAFGFGVSWLRQVLSGNGTTPDGTALVASEPAQLIDQSVFARDTFSPARRLSLLLDAWLNKSSLDPQARFDTQLAVVYRPTALDTIRLGAGRSTEEPSLQTERVNLLPVGALNPDCGAIAQATTASPAAVNVGSGPASNLAAETGSDLELGYDHRFGNDATLDLTVYDMNVTDRIVTGDFPAGPELPPSAIPPLLARISQFCGLSPSPSALTFTLSQSFNAATARLRGIELEGRVRVAPHVAVDYGFDLQSNVLNDLPASVLVTNPTLVNGLQVFGVPLHKETLGIDATTRGGLEVRVDGYAVGPNNPQQLPGYAYADASLAQAVSKHVTLLLAISNVFGSHAQSYGLVGSGLPYATNPYNAALGTPFLQPFNERYGLQPTSVTMSATLHL